MGNRKREIASFKRRFDEYKQGKISEREFMATYERLRQIVNRRYQEVERLGLISHASETVAAFNAALTDGESELFQAYTKIKDHTEQSYERMLEFYQSDFSLKSTYRKAVREIIDDFRNAGYNITEDEEDEFGKFVTLGDFGELAGLIGNSPEVYKDIENLINEGVTAEQLHLAFSDYIGGKEGEGYDDALRKARQFIRKKDE